MLTSAHKETIHISVSSITKPYPNRITFATIMKATTCTIIHSDRLYTDFFGFKHSTDRKNRAQHPTTRYMKLLY